MPDINITVAHKVAVSDTQSIVCDNSDYMVHWTLDEEWGAYDTKTMRTIYMDGTFEDKVFSGDTSEMPVCTVPGVVQIGLFAGDIRTSRVAILRALPSVRSAAGAPEDPPKNVYDQLMEIIKGMGVVDPDDIAKAVADYMAAHPIEETDPTVPSWAKAAQKPSYTASEVGADPSGTASAQVAAHNTGADTHGDIRLLISGLTDRLNSLANSDDTTLDQLSEIVAYIKSNRDIISAITTDKVNVSDIVNNLTTNISNKPLSAAQGVVIKTLIDALRNDKLDVAELTNAVNTALAQAKESGEFDGQNGHSPVVTATKSGKVTTIEVDGTAIATVNDGADAEDTRVIAVAIPSVVRVLTGSEFNIYYPNVVSQQNAMFWCSVANGLTTKRYGDHMSITANAPGTYQLNWKVYDSGYSLLASGTCTIIAAANKAVTASALVIGDSTVTQGGYICQKLLSCFSAAGGTLTLIGTRGTAPARHEGRAGWKASDYCTKAADGTYTNPFYNNGFDFSHYMTTQAYTGVGVVVIQLGINDIFYAGLDSFSAAETIGYFDSMVNSILSYDSSIKIIVDLLTPPNADSAVFTEKYGTSQIDFVYRMNTIRMSKALMEHFSGNASVSISPNNCVLNPAQDINDGVHPTEGGYAKLGQIIYETMLGVHSGDSGGGQVAPLWDMAGRTGVQWPEYSLGNVGRAFSTDKYYYPMSFTGTTQSPTAATMTDFAVGPDTLEFTIHAGSASASQLSGYGIVVPLALEAGKSYTFAAKCASTNSGVNLMTYNVSDGVWTYVSHARVCYSTTELCSASITTEDGKGYAICFSQKSGGVGTKNVFSQISLKEA